MSKIPSTVDIPSIPTKFDNLEEVHKYLVSFNTAIFNLFQDIYTEFDGKIDTVNMYCKTITIADTGLANTEFAIAHNLGHIQVYLLPNLNSSPGGDVTFYKDVGGTSWTKDTAYLKCTRANMNVSFLVWV